MDCRYCYYLNKAELDMPAGAVIALVKQLDALGVFQLMLGGGEPFLHPQIFDILDDLIDSGIKFAVLSNGTLLDRGACERIAELERRAAGNFFLQISLDSHLPAVNDASRGRGREAMAAIERLAELGVDVQIACVVSRKNIAVADQLIDYFYPRVRRYHYMGLMPAVKAVVHWGELFVPQSKVEALWQRLAEKQRRLPADLVLSYPCAAGETPHAGTLKAPGCLAGITRMDVDAESNVLACQIAHFARMGNLREQPFERIWSSAEAERLREAVVPLCWRNLPAPEWLQGAAPAVRARSKDTD
jgi:MoaA/NifB/PqqE/SkfB family radical SAM enzyme